MPVIRIVAARPRTKPSRSPIKVKNGSVAASARQRGTTNHLTGSNPKDRKASISSDTFIVAISEARPAPERPATTIAVTSGPNLPEVCDDYQLGDIVDCPEAPELRNAEKPDDYADHQVGGARDR